MSKMADALISIEELLGREDCDTASRIFLGMHIRGNKLETNSDWKKFQREAMRVIKEMALPISMGQCRSCGEVTDVKFEAKLKGLEVWKCAKCGKGG